MPGERVFDTKGRQWTVKRRFTSWQRVIQPFAPALGRYRRRKLRPVPRRQRPPKLTPGVKAALVEVAPFMTPSALLIMFLGSLAIAALVPLAVLEGLAQLVGGIGLAVARRLGWARYRVDVIGHTRHLLHSETVLLVRGGARARRLVDELEDRVWDAKQSFRPDGLPEYVEVRSHRSIWQSSAEWV